MQQLDPAGLFALDADVPDLRGVPMVQALDGFIDAGSATRLAREHLLSVGSPRKIVTFDHDQLFDYRARRPSMVFAGDHWESYDDPELAIFLLEDTAGDPVLLLSGPEPDAQWERFIEAVKLIIARLEIGLVVGLNAIPMALPHTRPVGVIAHGSSKELIAGYEPWVDTVQVPASAGHLLEFRLGQAGHPAVGFAAHVPHYLAQSVFPAAAAALVREINAVSKRSLSVADLDEAAVTSRTAIDEQVAQSEEVGSVVRGLEAQYDAFVAGRRQSLLADDSELPTGDELGAELERFLAEENGRGV